jgi:hypothetical protein
VRTAKDELRDLVRRRAVLSLEGVACAVAGAALWTLSERVHGSTPEVQSVFIVVATAFAVAFARLVAGMIPVLAFRCPRCSGLFHADASRGSIGIRACAHCGLSARDEIAPEADASQP